MVGTKAGGLKAAATNRDKYGKGYKFLSITMVGTYNLCQLDDLL